MSILLLYLMQGSHYIMMMVCSNIYVLLSIHTTWSNNKKFSLSDGMHISLIKIGGYFSHRHKIVQFCPTVMFDNHVCANAIYWLLLHFSMWGIWWLLQHLNRFDFKQVWNHSFVTFSTWVQSSLSIFALKLSL